MTRRGRFVLLATSKKKDLAILQWLAYLHCRYGTEERIVHAKVTRWGNSLAVRIPSSFAKDARLTTGSTVDISVRDGKIVIDPHVKKDYSLEELLKGVTRKNLHAEIDTGEAVGREIW